MACAGRRGGEEAEGRGARGAEQSSRGFLSLSLSLSLQYLSIDGQPDRPAPTELAIRRLLDAQVSLSLSLSLSLSRLLDPAASRIRRRAAPTSAAVRRRAAPKAWWPVIQIP